MYEKLSRGPRAILATALVAGIGGLGFAGVKHFESSSAALDLKLAGASQTSPSRTGFAPIVKKALPSVVTISAVKMSKTPAGFSGEMPSDELFRRFFGDEGGRRFEAPQAPPQNCDLIDQFHFGPRMSVMDS